MKNATRAVLAAAALAAGLAPALALAQAAPAARAASATAPVPAAAKPATAATIKVGLWETTTTTENPAANSRRSLVARSCVSAGDSTNIARIVPVQREPGMQCENREIKQEGGVVVWQFTCKSAGASQAGKARLTLFADSYSGAGEAELKKDGAKPIKVNQSFSGKWLSACG